MTDLSHYSVNVSLFSTVSDRMYDVKEIRIWITSLNNKHQRESYKQGINLDGTVKIFIFLCAIKTIK